MSILLEQRKLRVSVKIQRAFGISVVTYNYDWAALRMKINVRQGGRQFNNLRAQIFGLPLADMNNIARRWLEPLTPQNSDVITVDVYDKGVYTPFFEGVISWAGVDAAAMPQVCLNIEANGCFDLLNQATSPFSAEGPILLSSAIRQIAAANNYTLNYSRSAQDYVLNRVRVTGAPLNQVGSLIEQFPTLTWFVNLRQIVVRTTQQPSNTFDSVIDVQNGLIGAPTYSSSGLQIMTVFNSRIRPGASLRVTAPNFEYITKTKWIASVIDHTLEANVPGGRWSTSIAATAWGSFGNNQ